MNAPFANIFLAIQSHIAGNMHEISHIAHDLGQLSVKGRPPVSWPCVLIDFEDFSFSNLGEHIQSALGTVVVRLGFAPHSGTGKDTPNEYKERALMYYDMAWELHKLLHGWSPNEQTMGAMIRTSVTTQRRSDSYRVRELRYAIAFEDYSKKTGLQYVPATLVVDIGGGA
jgi:hypothetical protein